MQRAMNRSDSALYEKKINRNQANVYQHVLHDEETTSHRESHGIDELSVVLHLLEQGSSGRRAPTCIYLINPINRTASVQLSDRILVAQSASGGKVIFYHMGRSKTLTTTSLCRSTV